MVIALILTVIGIFMLIDLIQRNTHGTTGQTRA